MKCETCGKELDMRDRAELTEFGGQIGLTVECDCGLVYEAWVDSWLCVNSEKKTESGSRAENFMQSIGLKCGDSWVFAEVKEDGTCRLCVQEAEAEPDSEITLDKDSRDKLASFLSAKHYDNTKQ